MYDFLIVGCGMFGSVFARIIADQGKKCLIIDKRQHIAGNCYTRFDSGIHIHEYGPHIFHCNNTKIWEFVNRFAQFNNYQHRIKVNYKDKIFSFPINLMTLNQLWGVTNPNDAKKKLETVKIPCDSPQNAEQWILSQVGQEIYEIFYKEYTTKQWNRPPSELPASILKRLPIRLDFNDSYHDSKYIGIPIGGYTKMFENMLDHDNIKIELNVDYFEHKERLNALAKKIVYTGKIDEFFDYKYGELEYRGLSFHTSNPFDGVFQGISTMNYTSSNEKFTRIIEHKYFDYHNQSKTIVTMEYPKNYVKGDTPYYPIGNEKNIKLYEKYKNENSKVIFGGRLGGYIYGDMHVFIGSAMNLANKDYIID